MKFRNKTLLSLLAAAILISSFAVAVDNHPITRDENSSAARDKVCPVCFVRTLLSAGVIQAAFLPQIDCQPFYFSLPDGVTSLILSIILSPVSSRAPPTVSF